MSKPKFATIPIDQLELGPNIRDVATDIDDLVESIREHGVLQAITVWPNEAGTGFEVGFGKRRYTAARIAGLTELRVQIRARPGERERLVIQIEENLQRREMSPVDEGYAFQRLIELGATRKQVARSVHRSEGWVYDRLKLLDLPQVLRDAVHTGTLRYSVAQEFPIALGQRPGVIERLEKVAPLTPSTLRAFIAHEWRGIAPMLGKKSDRGVRVIAVPDHEAHDLAKRAAAERGIAVGHWTVEAIREKANREGAT